MFKLRLEEHCSCQEMEEENSSYLRQSGRSLYHLLMLRKVFQGQEIIWERCSVFLFPCGFLISAQRQPWLLEAVERGLGWGQAAELTLGHLWGSPDRNSLQGCGWGCPEGCCTEQYRMWPRGREGGFFCHGWLHCLFWDGLKDRAPSLLGRWEPSWVETADYF